MDSSLTSIRAFFQEPLDPNVSQALISIAKGDTSAVCYVLRYCLSMMRFKSLAMYLNRHGYVLTLSSEQRFLETVLKIAQEELGFTGKIVLEELLAEGAIEKKQIFVLDILTLCSKKNEELEKIDSVAHATSPASPYQSRRRSYSAGSEQLKATTTAIPIKPNPAEGRGIKAIRPGSNGPMSTETWVSSPSQSSAHSQLPPSRASYYTRSPSLTTHSSLHSAYREDESNLTVNTTRSVPMLPLSPNLPSATRLSSNGATSPRPAQLPEDVDGTPPQHSQHASIRNGSESPSGSSCSPRERMFSPQRKSCGQPLSYTTLSALKQDKKRFDLEDEMLKQINGHELIAERLSQLETRIEVELSTMNERFSRLEGTLNELTRALLAQTRSSPSGLHHQISGNGI